MTNLQRDAKEAAIFTLLRGYWQLAEKLDRNLLETYVAAVDECSTEAVVLVCQRVGRGQAGLNSSFPPTPADISERAMLLDAGKKPAPGKYNGLIEMDWGHGRVDLRGLTNDEQDAIIRNHGMIGIGENAKDAALMSLEEKLAALRDLKQLPPAKPLVSTVERKPWLEEDGWVEWSPEWGDFPPIDREALVWVKFSDSAAYVSPKSNLASDWIWTEVAKSTIVAYKLDRRITA